MTNPHLCHLLWQFHTWMTSLTPSSVHTSEFNEPIDPDIWAATSATRSAGRRFFSLALLAARLGSSGFSHPGSARGLRLRSSAAAASLAISWKPF